MYVCAQGVIRLMYWHLYFNLFQDLILKLWPWNQYLHLLSTTFNQFCPRLVSAMDCLTGHMFAKFHRSFLLPFLYVAVWWEVTSHLNPRSPASHHPPASPSSLLSCTASLCPPPAFTTLLESWLAVLTLWFMTNKALRQQQSERQACKTKTNGHLLVMSFSSFHNVHSIWEFLPCLLMVMQHLTPVK